MNNIYLLSLVALTSGALIAVQASTNAALLQSVGNVLWVAIALFTVGLVYLATMALVSGSPTPSLNHFSNAPKWSYFGGIIVATYVIVITYLVPKIGAGNAIIYVEIHQQGG